MASEEWKEVESRRDHLRETASSVVSLRGRDLANAPGRRAALRCEIKSLVHGGLLLFAAGRNRHNVLGGASLAGFVLKATSGPPKR